MLLGIYCIQNTVNGKLYVGSAKNIEQRWGQHKLSLLSNKHHSILLQRAWNKYGESAFEFKILEEVLDKSKLIEREQYWLNKYKSCNPDSGYNINPTAGNNFGRKFGCHTEEHKNKISQTLLSYGLKRTQEHKDAIRQSKLGKKRSEITRKKISLSQTGKRLGRIPWNKGLTKQDPRVAKNYIKRDEI